MSVAAGMIGLGTSRTFDVAPDSEQLAQLLPVLQAFFAHGGGVIDTSPMYGHAEAVLGKLLQAAPHDRKRLFAATKVWTWGREAGVQQMQESMRLTGIDRFDLIQIHNLRDWQVHLETLREWKRQGKVRYIGITTSHGRAHEELAQALSARRAPAHVSERGALVQKPGQSPDTETAARQSSAPRCERQ